MYRALIVCSLIPVAACSSLEEVGRAPALSPIESSDEFRAMTSAPLPTYSERGAPNGEASLWSGSRGSLLGDRRASQSGDIMTVVIEIDDKAEISNSTGRARTGSNSMGISSLFGIPERLAEAVPGLELDPAIGASSATSFNGNGSVSRNEKLTLRVAVTVIERLPNGVLRIQGSQEVRVNFEVRELIVTGFVRPEDISRQNEITYDKIAGARISYGGRGQITAMQQPSLGQQITDIVSPY